MTAAAGAGGGAGPHPLRFDVEASFGPDYLHFYLPAFTDERNRAEADEVAARLELRAGERLLDVPCGHGRLTTVLAERGVRAVGLDLTAGFLALAASASAGHGSGPAWVRGDMEALPLAGGFDAAVCWFTSFGYADDDGSRRFLAEVRRVLRPGGRLLIETLHRDGFVRGLVPATVTEVGGDLLVDRTTFDCLSGRLVTRRTVVRQGGDGPSTSVHSIRLPTPSEITGWLHAAGFDDVRCTTRGGAPLTVDTRRLVVLAR